MALKIETPSITYFVRKRHGAPVYEALLRDTDAGDIETVGWSPDQLINLITGVRPEQTTQIPESAVPAPP